MPVAVPGPKLLRRRLEIAADFLHAPGESFEFPIAALCASTIRGRITAVIAEHAVSLPRRPAQGNRRSPQRQRAEGKPSFRAASAIYEQVVRQRMNRQYAVRSKSTRQKKAMLLINVRTLNRNRRPIAGDYIGKRHSAWLIVGYGHIAASPARGTVARGLQSRPDSRLLKPCDGSGTQTFRDRSRGRALTSLMTAARTDETSLHDLSGATGRWLTWCRGTSHHCMYAAMTRRLPAWHERNLR